jgi:hypothetical protein
VRKRLGGAGTRLSSLRELLWGFLVDAGAAYASETSGGGTRSRFAPSPRSFLLVSLFHSLGMAQPPSSPQDVLQALSYALSPDPQQRTHSLSLLQQWALLPGYYSLLVGIFTAREGVQREIRLQAALQFKNGVDKYWRKGAPKCVPLLVRVQQGIERL